MSGFYRLAAALALALELLIAGHVIDLPVLHNAGPLAATGAAFIVTFVANELIDVLAPMVRRWRWRNRK